MYGVIFVTIKGVLTKDQRAAIVKWVKEECPDAKSVGPLGG